MKKRLSLLLAACLFAVAGIFAQESIPWTNDLEGGSSDFGKFTVVSGLDGGAPKLCGDYSQWTVHSGQRCIELKGSGTGVLAFPAMNADLSGLRLQFYSRIGSFGEYATCEVGYLTDVSDASTFVSVKVLDNPSNYSFSGITEAFWTKIVVDFTGAPDDARIALRYSNGSSSISWYVDDVEVMDQPSCMGISGTLATSNLTFDGVTLSFTDESGASAWNLYYKSQNDNEYTKVSLTETSYDLTGLTEKTNYTAFVKTDCGGDEEGEPSNTVTWKTPANPATSGIASIPWNDDLEDGMDEYTFFTNNNSYPQYFTGYSPACHSGQGVVESKQGEGLVVLPALRSDIDITTLRLSFWHKENSSSIPTIKVGYLTDLSDKDSFVQVAEIPNNYYYNHSGATGFVQVNVDFPSTAAGAQYIALKFGSASSSSYYVDDFTLTLQPECPKIAGTLICKTSDDNSATLSFTDDEDQS